MSASLAAVCVGMPQILTSSVNDSRRPEWTSAIVKTAVNGKVWAGKINLAGDAQADLNVHGGPDQAILGYSVQNYDYWRAVLPDVDWQPGGFGENFAIDGQTEDSVCLGDVYAVGGVRIEVTKPRGPCYKISRRYGLKPLTALVEETGYTGWYYRVLNEGEVEAGMAVELIERPHPRISIRMMTKILQAPEEWIDLARELAASPATTDGWRRKTSKALSEIEG